MTNHERQATSNEQRATAPRRILIARLDRLGDVVLSTPVIRHMRMLFPDAYIAFMVRPENRDVVESNPHLNEIVLYDKAGSEKGWWGTLKFALSLRKFKFDTAVALHPSNRTHLILFLAGIPSRIGYDRKMAWTLTKRVRHGKQEGAMHESDYNFELLAKSGFNVMTYNRAPYIHTGDHDKMFVDYLQSRIGIGAKVIAFHPGASCQSKRWTPDRFAAAADILGERYASDIVIVGGKGSEEYGSLMAAAMKRKAFDLTGKTGVGALAELLARSRLFVSNDSGPVHVAVAVGVPVIAIFGRKDPGLSPRRWGPLGARDIALHKDVGCVTCLAHNCGKDFRCLKAVTVDDVIRAAERILG